VGRSLESYPIPAKETRVHLTVVNSRFIATAAPVFTVEEAKAFIARIKAEFADATHNVPAYLVGHGATVTAHCSDDGEPSGTAGRPALAVLQGSGLGDVAVVITRYFGGTKPGTGGLVRAYGDAVREVLAVLPRATKVPTHVVRVVTPYSGFERLRRLIAAHGGEILREGFEAEVAVRARFAVDRFSAFEKALQEAFSGTLTAEIVVRDEIAIVPV
jgi:uncharacterized YigZ family protein